MRYSMQNLLISWIIDLYLVSSGALRRNIAVYTVLKIYLFYTNKTNFQVGCSLSYCLRIGKKENCVLFAQEKYF